MSSGSPEPSVAPSSSISPSAGTLHSTPTRKKRTILVVRRPQGRPPVGSVGCDGADGGAPASTKKKIVVARRPRASEGRLFDGHPTSHQNRGVTPIAAGVRREATRDGDGHHLPLAAAGQLQWLPDGRVLEKSVLGTAEAFEEMDALLGWAARPEHEDDDSQQSFQRAESSRSFRSFKSMRSLRSLKSRARLSTGDRSSTGHGSRVGASPDESSDLQRDMERYMRRIAEAEEVATRNRVASARKEAKLMEHVGLTEKLTIRREGNSIRQWKRWQRDWQRVSEDVASKTGKMPHDLIMSTADEYRERSEEYQLIQCAIPTYQKFSSEGYWVMSLRGIGDRKCNVGNIFSGLTCAIDDRTPAPRAVRKPTGRPADATRKRTWRNSEAFIFRKRQLASTLKRLRPQHFQPDETDGLLVQGQDLLEWAAVSSREYFRLRHLEESEAVIAGLRALEEENHNGVRGDPALSTARGGRRADLSARSAPTRTPRVGPAIEVTSPQTLLIESKAGQNGLEQAAVTVRNTGSTVLFFSWARVTRGETIVSVNGAFGVRVGDSNGKEGLLAENGAQHMAGAAGMQSYQGGTFLASTEAAATVARHAALQSPESRFFCSQATGTLLPGEMTTTSFSFKSTEPGVFSDRWRLETAPPASFIFCDPPEPPIPSAAADKNTADPRNDFLSSQAAGASFPTISGGANGGGGVGEVAKFDGVVDARRRSSLYEMREGIYSGDGGDGRGGRRVVLGMTKDSAPTNGSAGGGGVEVGLRGVALAPDIRGHVRKMLSEGITRGVLAAKMEEIVREVVRGVRTPVREEEIRRRQRKEFLSINADQGLYFTPQLYDGFMSLLQRAKAIAASAEAGKYDVVDSDDNVDDVQGGLSFSSVGVDPFVTAAQKDEERGQEDVEQGTVAVRPVSPGEKAMVQGKETGGGKGEEEGDTSECSTRPVSAQSSSGEENDDDASDHYHPLANEDGIFLSAVDNGAAASSRNNFDVAPAAATDQGNDQAAEQLPDEDDARDSTVPPDEAGGKNVEGDGICDVGVDVGKEEREDQGQSKIHLLRKMLEMLDCREWDGGVNTVLDAIEDLTRWIPAPSAGGGHEAQPDLGPGGRGSNSAAGLAKDDIRGSGDDRAGRNPGDERGNENEEGNYQVKKEEGGAEEEDAGDEENKDDEEEEDAQEDGDEEEEEEEEEEEGGDEEEGEESETDTDEDEAGQHPVQIEQRAMRAQWRRLVLDAKLEPEVGCTDLMREVIENMVGEVAGVIEEVRRKAVAGAGAGGGKSSAAAVPAAAAPGAAEVQTPRGRVLGYDEDSIADWAAACPPDSSTYRDVDGGPQARAAAAAKAGNLKASFLALAYGEVSSTVATAVETFETRLSSVEAERRAAASSTRRTIVLKGPDCLSDSGGGSDTFARDGSALISGDDGNDIATDSGVVSPPPLSRLAALKWEDIGGRRILLHVDLSAGMAEESVTDSADGEGGGGGTGGIGKNNDGVDLPLPEFPESVRAVAEQVREMLSAKPAAVAIVSEMAPRRLVGTTTTDAREQGAQVPSRTQTPSSTDPETRQTIPTGSPEVVSTSPTWCISSLRASAAAVSSLLGMEVDFYDTVPELAMALGRCVGGGGGGRGVASGGESGGGDGGAGASSPPFGMVPLMMVERLSLPGVVPAPPLEEPDLSDEEEERLPDFSWGGEEMEAAAERAREAEALRLAVQGPGEGDLSALLEGVVDVAVMDAPRALYEPRRKLPWGPVPTTGLTVAGSGLHGDLTAMAYLTECSDRPLLAVMGGGSLEPRLKLVDGLLDLVDTLAIGGGLAATFIAAAAADLSVEKVLQPIDSRRNSDAATAETQAEARKRARKLKKSRWMGKGTAGPPRDPPDVVDAARRLLVKARKRGVNVILPTDFVVGDIEVDENGHLPGQITPDDEDKNETDGNDNDVEVGVSDPLGGEDDDGDAGSVHESAAPVDVEPEDPAVGFEYDGETMDVSVEDGIPKGFRPMDVGPQTTANLRDAVGRARAVLWHGMLGVAECSAFQFGTREVLEAAISAHDNDELREVGASPVVILCGRSLGEWAGRFAEVDEDVPPLGSGSGVSHICTDPAFCSRVLEGRIVPGLSQLSERDPRPADADLGKVLRRGPFGENEEDEEDDGDGADGESDTDSSN